MLKRLFLNERFILLAVLCNAAIIFALYFPDQHDNYWLLALDHLFILFFLIEVIVKLAVLKPKAYFVSAWNRFDFIIIVCSLPVLLEPFMSVPDGASLLILLRLFRVVRLARLMRFIPNIEQVVNGLGRALRASVFVLAALVFLNLLVAIITCHFYADIAPAYFGNPLVSIYSVFQLFTLEGWNEIPAAIISNPDTSLSDTAIGITRFYFAMIVVLGGVFGMSLANAIFVDEMTMDNNQELEAKVDLLLAELRELRQAVDSK